VGTGLSFLVGKADHLFLSNDIVKFGWWYACASYCNGASLSTGGFTGWKDDDMNGSHLYVYSLMIVKYSFFKFWKSPSIQFFSRWGHIWFSVNLEGSVLLCQMHIGKNITVFWGMSLHAVSYVFTGISKQHIPPKHQ
jgi:hypothetical protein